MDLDHAGCQSRFLIRDPDGQLPHLFNTVLADAGIEGVLGGVRIPRMNSITERWVQACRRELLDRTLIWNQRHLRHALREVRRFHNGHRPHRGIANAAPPRPSPIRRRSPASTYVDTNRSAASGTSTDMRRDQRGWGLRQPQGC
ncbi:integrase core domain-containing protein [Streptomyces mirabilis]|uniref:integrase core domain-containing protein n=1 Tax=Streptomyces mirabilis TaxID=68239 RepID=UPI00368EB4F1